MDKKEEFKIFISKHPEILEYIKNKEMTFQDFYEIYDIYGDDEKTWDRYFSNGGISDKLGELSKIIKNINIDNVEKHINNAQKAISIIQELTKKEPVVENIVDNPITKFYGD